MKVVRKYGQASSQCINFKKYSLLFGNRIDTNGRQKIKETTRIQIERGMEIYLVILEDISGSKCKHWVLQNSLVRAVSSDSKIVLNSHTLQTIY